MYIYRRRRHRLLLPFFSWKNIIPSFPSCIHHTLCFSPGLSVLSHCKSGSLFGRSPSQKGFFFCIHSFPLWLSISSWLICFFTSAEPKQTTSEEKRFLKTTCSSSSLALLMHAIGNPHIRLTKARSKKKANWTDYKKKNWNSFKKNISCFLPLSLISLTEEENEKGKCGMKVKVVRFAKSELV